MSSRYKDFGSAVSEKEAIVFKLHEEEFTCIPTIQGKVLMDLVSRSQSEDSAVAMAVVDTFFEKVLEDESLDRFNDLLTSKDRVVAMETLAEIITWLVEEYSGRPEAQPEQS